MSWMNYDPSQMNVDEIRISPQDRNMERFDIRAQKTMAFEHN